MKTRSGGSLLAAFCLLAALVAPAAAHPEEGAAAHRDDGVVDSGSEVHAQHQHGGGDGHLPAGSDNVAVIGKAAIDQHRKDGRVADVEVFGDYAYLGGFWEPDCKRGGVYVLDISDLSKPHPVGFIPTSNDTFVGEGVQVIHIDTPSFTGDVLGFNNEICDVGVGDDVTPNGGLTLVDVTRATAPRPLATHVGDIGADGKAHEIHSVFMWDAGDRAYAAIVDDDEAEDVDILDVSDPRNPVLIAEYDLEESFPQIVQAEGGLDSIFLHDMVVKQVGAQWLMVASYWDGGYVVLDVTDPAHATYVADSDFTFPDPEAAESGLTVDPEGNAHYAELTRDDRYLVAADEDFDPYKTVARNVDDGTEFTAIPGSDTPGVPVGGTITGDTVYLGLACGSVPAATVEGQIALVERGTCAFQTKLDNVVAAGGYSAALVFNRAHPSDGCNTLITMLASSDLPSMFITREAGFGLLDLPYDQSACMASDGTQTAGVAVGTVGDTVHMSSTFDGWGYIHLYENGSGKLAELDTFAIPEAHEPAHASGSGDLSVHEVATSEVDDTLVYSAYYAGGFRVLRIVETDDGAELEEVGHFIDDGGSNLWGVEVFQRDGKEYVAASDRDFGLYIFEYTGP
jgi:hypothetical protein